MGTLALRWLGRIRSPIEIGFFVGVAGLVLVGLLSLRSATNQRREGKWVEHTYQVLRELDQAIDDLDAEREPQQLVQDLSSRVKRLRTLTSDNPLQQAQLDSFAHSLPSDRQRALASMTRMEALEQDSLAVRSHRTDASNRLSMFVIVTSTLLAVTLMALALHLLHDDLARRRLAEQALVESEAKHRLLMRQAADAILIVNPEALCLDANERAEELLGRPKSDITGLPLRSFLRGTGDTAFVLPMLRYGHVTTGEFVVERRDGTNIPVEIRATILDDGRVQIIARDISERREVERMKDEFVSIVSHELRTPLTSVRGALGLLASGRLASSPERQTRMLDLAVANTDRLIRLVNDILDVERIESGAVQFERVECDPRPLLEHVIEVMRPAADRAGVNLAWTCDDVRIWADPDRMTQTLVNLVDNAVKFSPAGSVVSVSVTTDDEMAHFEVRDQGRGIPADKRETVFRRFQQVDNSDAREKGGTGLGLPIARSIVEQHGGKMWIADAVDVGTSFCFTIPLVASAMPLAASAAS